MNKAFTLCADDFAQNAAISDAVLELLSARRLSATSVFSQSTIWPALAPQLRQITDIDIGLHFNLTQPFDGKEKPLPYWLVASQIGGLSLTVLSDSLRRQMDAFTSALGRLPDFIDGHQHVHALPQIRHALFSVLGEYAFPAGQPYLRAPDRLGHPGDSRLKEAILRMVCRGFADAAATAGFCVPAWFGGLYSLSPKADYRALMIQWLAAGSDGALLMCHPGRAEAGDPIAGTRVNECRYLGSDRFIEDCAQAGVALQPFKVGQAI